MKQPVVETLDFTKGIFCIDYKIIFLLHMHKTITTYYHLLYEYVLKKKEKYLHRTKMQI